MSYILPVTINERRVYHLDLMNGSQHQKPEPFIAPLKDGRVIIYTLDKDRMVRTLEIGGHRDILLQQCAFQPAYDEVSRQLVLHIMPEKPAAAATFNTQDTEDDVYEQYQDTGGAAFVQEHPAQLIADLGEGIRLHWQETKQQVIIFTTGRLAADEEQAPALQLSCLIRLNLKAELFYAASFLVQLVHPFRVLQGALDFGSEASQLVQQRTHEKGGFLETSTTTVHLFKKLKALLGMPDAPDYLQEEKGQPFYKSVFFVRKNLEGQDEFFSRKRFLPDEEKNLIMMLSADDVNSIEETHHQLPNLKLARKHEEAPADADFTVNIDGDEELLSRNDILDRAFASILRNMIRAWLLPELRYATSGQYVQLTLLVPNIYDEKDVSKSIQILHDIFKGIQEEKGEQYLAGWELLTVSESDASFLGFQQLQDLQPVAGKYYISIDCGKGTTDFSIVRTGDDPGKPLQPVYRNGFAGAGNLITYAIFQSVIAYVVNIAQSKEAGNEFILKNVVAADPYFKLQLFELLERLKFRYSEENELKERDIAREWNNADMGEQRSFKDLLDKGATVETLNVFLGKVNNISDVNGYINEVCNAIVSAIVNNLSLITASMAKKNLQCAGVYLTGRGFLFRPLTHMLIDQLRHTLKLPEDAIRTPATDAGYKSICLRGVLNNSFVLQPEIIGWPVQVYSPDAGNTDVPAVRNKPSYLSHLLNLIPRAGGNAVIKNTDALSALLGNFHEHKLLIGDKLWWPENKNFRSGANQRLDLLFQPHAKSGRFLVRSMTEQGFCLDHCHLVWARDVDSYTDAYLKPSLFPAIIDEADIAALIEKI